VPCSRADGDVTRDALPPHAEIETDLDAGQALAPSAGAVLLVVRVAGTTRAHEVPDGGEVVVGRAEDAAIAVPETTVSRRHAVFRRAGAVLTLEDLGSRNGVILNGAVLRAATRALASGDVVRVGSAEIVVAASPAAGAGGRLERELERVARAGGGRATLLRIAPRGAGSLAVMGVALAAAELIEERGDGEYGALIAGADPLIASGVVERLRRIDPRVEVGVATFPADGASAAELWDAAAVDPGRAADAEAPAVVAADPAMIQVLRLAARLAQTPSTVLVLGETGAGKEVVAEEIHRASPRAAGPFIRLNCASLPEALLESELFGHEKGAFTGADKRKVGYFEAAHGGTLLLDEIGELPLAMQAKLLRVLERHAVVRVGGTQEIPVDTRVVCATHKDLAAEVERGGFRADLFYRIATFRLQVPPLRERPAEIAVLAKLFAERFAARLGVPVPALDGAALAALAAWRWPGNVRELRNAMEHALVMADAGTIMPEHLPAEITGASRPEPAVAGGIQDRLAAMERRGIEAALAACGGNRTHAAKRLGISRRALLYKLHKYGLGRGDEDDR
jgi:DNA-binding NtrC family response regulator